MIPVPVPYHGGQGHGLNSFNVVLIYNVAYNCHLQSQSYILCAFLSEQVALVGGIRAPTGHFV